ncbi:23S rRNA (uracil(1939)-C(5))-methyltransferase RlmD [candidate division WOR-3 bacterium]|uniref:23S rRNA (Uracil(1939)-C(5))-methyltransferase RlmD n=1 Tax=candidate division WOR-3 bacterium TaxID=2052148 RepID=A0A9D5KA95_UNCW3|nr:23S rRNA (uracil(1939)-C(5))-methyltransferase RlmD [candidate division WOR-3 bacterium]MBD3365373.1 23S rRNA (uracil(1939)-C(5))-methyltransferase RlmD [candidate division WOR-3 bacterium]
MGRRRNSIRDRICRFRRRGGNKYPHRNSSRSNRTERPPGMVGLKVNIEKVVAGGDGLTHLPDGRVLFVPFSLPAEELEVNITREKKDYAVGEIKSVLTPSPDRICPICAHFGSCGGCQLQHVSYEGEIKIKKTILKETISRQTGINIQLEAVYPSPKEWGYRGKSEHPAAPSPGGPKIGYFRRRTHEVVDIKECPVLAPEMLSDLSKIRDIVRDTGEPIYDEEKGRGNLRYIILRSSSEGERMIGLVTSGKDIEGDTIVRLMSDFKGLKGIVQNINTDKGNRIMGEHTEIITGSDHLTEQVGELELKVSFASFFQANHSQAERIVKVVRDYLVPDPSDVVVDAFAGVGMIGLALAGDVKETVAVESEESSVRDGKRNAERNSLANVRWVKGEAGKVLGEIPCDKLILDPPRKGLTDNVISSCSKVKPSHICYVSCNPSTWARDVVKFRDAGYILKRLSMIDMFPRTAHLELASLLEAA